MANTLSKLTTAGNLYTTGILDEATFNPTSSYRKNLAAYSQTGSQWRISNSSPLAIIVSTTELAPDGTNTAVRVRPAVQYAGIQTPNACWISKTLITVSAWLRVDSGTRQIGFGSNGGAVAGSQNTVTSTWQRFSLTYTTSVSFNDYFVVYEPNTSGFVDYLVWGLQVEKGTTATIYEATGANAIPLANSLSKLDTSGNYYTAGTIDEVTFNPIQTEYRKNLISYSQNFENGVWGSIYVITNATTSPSGDNTGQKFYTTPAINGSSVQRISTFINFIAGKTYTYSVYVKPAEYSQFNLFSEQASRIGIRFNLSTNSFTVYGGSPTNTFINSVGNGWYRVGYTFIAPATETVLIDIQILNNSGVGTFIGDGSSGIYIWGSQLEIGNQATIYEATGANAIPSSNTLSKLDTTGNHYLLGTYDEVSGILPVTDGLVLYLDASYSESYSGSGTIWNDLSGSNNTVTLVSPIYKNPYPALTFNGSNYGSKISTNNIPSGSNPFTLSVWFYPTSGTTAARIVSYGAEANGQLVSFRINSGAAYALNFGHWGGAGYDLGVGYANRNSWNHLVEVFDGTTSFGYLNGTLVSTQIPTAINIPANSTLYVGKRATGENFAGSVSQVLLYNRALVANEVLNIFNVAKLRYAN